MTEAMTVVSPGTMTFSREQIDLIKRTVAVDCTDDELALYLHVAQRAGLDPLIKQVYAIKRWSAAVGKKVMTIQTSIDGFRQVSDRTGCYAPGREPTYDVDGQGKLVAATAYIRKMTPDGTWHEVAATARYAEYVQLDAAGKPTKFWQAMPFNQLAKCAEALAHRRAFPILSQIYTWDEMQQASNSSWQEGAETTEEPRPKRGVEGLSRRLVPAVQVPPVPTPSGTACAPPVVTMLPSVSVTAPPGPPPPAPSRAPLESASAPSVGPAGHPGAPPPPAPPSTPTPPAARSQAPITPAAGHKTTKATIRLGSVYIHSIRRGPAAMFIQIVDGPEVSVFHSQVELVETVVRAEEEGIPIDIEYRRNGKFNNLVDVKVLWPDMPEDDHDDHEDDVERRHDR